VFCTPYLTSVDCSGASDQTCGAANRQPCTAGVVGNACGNCLFGFTGPAGPSNTICASTYDAATASCVMHTLNCLLLAVDCTTRPPAACAALNRQPCSATAFKCGGCLNGYSGVVGDSNELCTATGMVLRVLIIMLRAGDALMYILFLILSACVQPHLRYRPLRSTRRALKSPLPSLPPPTWVDSVRAL